MNPALNSFCLLRSNCKNKEGAKQLSSKISEYCETIIVQADVTDCKSVDLMYDIAAMKFGFIDTVINNAGVSLYKLLQDTALEEWKKIIEVNLNGVFHVCHAVLPKMIDKKTGTIINISSMWGEAGASMEVAYSAAKAGVIGFTKALAKEVGYSGIRVNAIAPGVINTDMNRNLDKQSIDCLIGETPLSRIGQAIDVAEAALYLASDKASFITGHVLSVNGGYVI